MKKFILAITALLTTMIMIAQPLFVKPIKANAAVPTFVNEPQPIFEDMWSEPINNENYVYSYNKLLSYFTNTYTNTIPNSANYFSMTYKQKTPSSYDYQNMCFWYDSADVSIDGNHIVIQNMVNGSIHSQCTYDNVDVYQYGLSKVDFDFDTFTFQFWDRSGGTYNLRYLYQASWPVTDIWNVYTNIEGFSTPSLDLSISFAYPFSGTMTRHTTGDNGLPTAADGNIMYVDNRRGADAQFLMAIVPHGQTLSFNTWIYTGRDNIIGNPQYVYVCDEWQTFGALSAINIGDSTASANSIYAACAWHASPAGSTRSYNLMYESMDLKANTEYDVLVYACLNSDMEEMSGFYYDNNNLGGTYSVCGTLTDVELVYSSTFSMTDPMKFNPDYKNVHDSSYAWNPNDTNAELWENGSAYKDENGNVVIKGFKTGSSTLSWENSGSGSGYGNISGGSGANINVQKSFGGFFGFFKGLLGLLPMEYNLLITFGIVGLVAIAIIKAVT